MFTELLRCEPSVQQNHGNKFENLQNGFAEIEINAMKRHPNIEYLKI